MKILIVIGAYFPALNFGGPVISIDNLCRQLQNDIDFYIVTLDHDLKSSKRMSGIKEGWNDIGYAKVKYLRDEEATYQELFKITENVDPDIIYINNFFWAQFTIPFLKIAQKTQRHLIVASRGEFFESALNKKYKKLPYIYLIRKLYIRENVFFHATSSNESDQLKKYMKLDNNNIFNLPNMVTLCDVEESKDILNRKILKVVYLARIHKSKNLLYALNVLSEITFSVQFDIYGNIEDGLYWSACKSKIRNLGSNINVKYLGIATRNEIQSVFSTHHVFLFPTVTENFGHSIAESLLSGCPVIISNNTPWNWITEEKCGYALSLDDKKDYVGALLDIHQMSNDEYLNMRSICKIKTKEYLKVNELKERYKRVFLKIAEKEW